MKNTIRKQAIEKRRTLDCIELSNEIVKNLISVKEYQKSKNIICYYPLNYEVNTKILLENKLKNWYLPRVNGESLEICPCSNLKKGSFGIIEPQSKPIKYYENIDMVIIPACAADRKGYRLGWGKGYYDRFLPKLDNKCIKVIVIYSQLLYDSVFPEKHDIKADLIVTDKEILRL